MAAKQAKQGASLQERALRSYHKQVARKRLAAQQRLAALEMEQEETETLILYIDDDEPIRDYPPAANHCVVHRF